MNEDHWPSPSPESPADAHLREQREEVRMETTAMSEAYAVLQPLGEEARYRALRWLTYALDLPPRMISKEPPF